MNIVTKKLLAAGFVAMSLGTSTAIAQDAATGFDYWAAKANAAARATNVGHDNGQVVRSFRIQSANPAYLDNGVRDLMGGGE